MKVGIAYAFSAILLLITEPLAAQSLEARAIARVKQTPASRLEAGLPPERFVTWFRKVVGPSAKIGWELNDCGEQTGTPADAGRDFPACVGVSAALSDGRTVHVLISVGTFKKGLAGVPALRLITMERRGQFTDVPRLSDLTRAVRR